MPLSRAFRRRKNHLLPPGERLYAIGDIHGRLDLFDTLIDRIEADNAERGVAKVTVLLLGDLIDRGPDSHGVVERAIHWDADFATLECLLGNHEASMLAVLDGQMRWFGSWLGYGGYDTLLSYGVGSDILASGEEDEIVAAAQDAVPQAHRDWLEKCPFSVSRGDYIFVHAGIRPGVPLGKQEAKDLLWIRGEFLTTKADHGAMIVHGHSITPEVEEKSNRIGIDTGAYFSEKLTALGLEAGERWFLQT
ncbi:MAG: serine/threonine protein phosphatase [Sphingomonadaceae bacterium]|nr:serine/threonine protein phosphatase [Sphingomonadaceae bacterium]